MRKKGKNVADIWLVQLLCPARHALCAVPYEPARHRHERIEAAMAALMQEQGLNRWCGICGSHDVHAKHARMRVSTWDEALAVLQAEEEKQAVTRALIGNRF